METNEELIKEARDYALALHSSVHVRHTGAELIDKLADALEAATTEWEYGVALAEGWIAKPRYPTAAAASDKAREWSMTAAVVGRRKAGPWLPAEGEAE